MTIIDFKSSAAAAISGRRRRARALSRPTICALEGLAEGSVAAAILIACSFTYHLVVLAQGIDEFPWRLYLGCGLLIGAIFGAFAAGSCGRLLDGGQMKLASLPESFYAWTAAMALVLLIAFLGGDSGKLSRVSLTSAYFIGVPVLLLLRGFIHQGLAESISRGELHFEQVAIIGYRAEVVGFLLGGNLWRHGQRLAGALYLEDIADGENRINAIAEFARLSVRGGAQHILFIGDIGNLDGLQLVVEELRRFALNVVCAPASGNRTLKFLDVVAIGPNNALRFLRKPMTDAAVVTKRTIDIIGAGLGLLLLSPVLAGAALAILVTMGTPIIYRQERRGFNGENFMIWKFRSMTVTESGRAMRQAQRNDPRITPVGRFLRASSIDELPQLVNVLGGQMSLVGPRPHAISHDEALERQMEKYAQRQRIKPGITGWAQVNGYRGETTTFAQIEGRTLHDLHYIENWSVFLDLWIILLTVFSPATRRNAA